MCLILIIFKENVVQKPIIAQIGRKSKLSSRNPEADSSAEGSNLEVSLEVYQAHKHEELMGRAKPRLTRAF